MFFLAVLISLFSLVHCSLRIVTCPGGVVKIAGHHANAFLTYPIWNEVKIFNEVFVEKHSLLSKSERATFNRVADDLRNLKNLTEERKASLRLKIEEGLKTTNKRKLSLNA